MDTVRRAVQGIYHARGHDESEEFLSLLVYRLGGARLLDVLNRSSGFLSTSTVRRRISMVTVVASPSRPVRPEVEANARAVLAPLADLMSGDVVVEKGPHLCLMMDEVAVCRRLRYDPRTNKIVGLCRECESALGGREFASLEDVELVLDEIKAGKVHLACEAKVAAIGLLTKDSRLNSARPVLVSGSCKRESASAHSSLISEILAATNVSQNLHNARYVCISSDGEARRGKALVDLTFRQVLDPTSPIYDLLASLDLLDLHVGDDDLTADKDWKHVILKRIRNALLRPGGVVVDGVRVTPSILKKHLADSGHSDSHIRSMFNVADRQDVTLSFQFLRDIWSLPEVSAESGQMASYVQVRNALRLLGKFCSHLILPYVSPELSLSEQLEHLSCAAHLALGLFVQDNTKTDFLPLPLYVDIQIMIKNVLFCIAKAKADHPLSEFFIILLGTDRLESQFGIVRTMVGNDANVDLVQLAGRLAGSADVATIYAKYPQWYKGPRRLSIPSLSSDSHTMSHIDHLSPRHWKGNVFVQNVSLVTAWKRGRNEAVKLFPKLGGILEALQRTPGASLLAPFGTLLVHAALKASAETAEDLNSEATPQDEFDNPDPDVQPGDGLCDFEDTLATETDTAVTPRFSTRIVYRGQMVNKSRALAQLFRFYKTTDSQDRLRRVRGEGRFAHVLEEGADASASSEDALSIGQPIATLLASDKRYYLAIADVVSLRLNSKPRDTIPIDILHDKAVSATIQVLNLMPCGADGTQWRTDSLLPVQATISGPLIHPINPTASALDTGAVHWLFDPKTLIALTHTLYTRFIPTFASSIHAVAVTNSYPYRTPSGEAAFVAEPLDLASTIEDQTTRRCPLCTTPPVLFRDATTMLHHIGAHILFDSRVSRKAEPCGMCLKDGGLACKVYLSYKDGRYTIDWKRTQCQGHMRFKYPSAAKSTEGSPSSNVPLPCKLCDTGNGKRGIPGVWRYNYDAHLLNCHPLVDRNAPVYKALSELTDFEMEQMEIIYHTKHRMRTLKNDGPVLKPSTELSSARALLADAPLEDGDSGTDEDAVHEPSSDDDDALPPSLFEISAPSPHDVAPPDSDDDLYETVEEQKARLRALRAAQSSTDVLENLSGAGESGVSAENEETGISDAHSDARVTPGVFANADASPLASTASGAQAAVEVRAQTSSDSAYPSSGRARGAGAAPFPMLEPVSQHSSSDEDTDSVTVPIWQEASSGKSTADIASSAPDTLCPYCDAPMPPPEERTPQLKRLLAATEKRSQPAPRPGHPFARRAPISVHGAVCERHKFEMAELPRARARGWPTRIDWGVLRARIEELQPRMARLIEGDAEARRESVYWRSVEEDVLKSGARAVAGVKGQFESFDKVQPGYYGEKGAHMIFQIVHYLFPSFDTNALGALTPDIVLQRVLVPEVALALVMDDLGVDAPTASRILKESARYGAMMYPLHDDGSQEQDQRDIGHGMVRERARARARVIAMEERVEEIDATARAAASVEKPSNKRKRSPPPSASPASPPIRASARRRAPRRRSAAGSGEPRQCTCGAVANEGDQDVVACGGRKQGDGCPTGFFHTACVDMTVTSSGVWYCESCRVNQKRPRIQ